MQHVLDAPDAAFMRPGTEGVEVHELVAPVDGEMVLQKARPNSFRDTGLESFLRNRKRRVDTLVVCG